MSEMFAGLLGGGAADPDGKGKYGAVDVKSALGTMSMINGLKNGDPEAALAFGRKEVNALIQYAEEGDWTWKILGLFGGIAMVGCGAMSFLGDFLFFNYFGAVLDVYIILFGFLAIILEYKESILPTSMIDSIKTEAKFMYKPYGRAVLYCFFGVLLISQEKLLYLCTGLYLCGIGGLVIYYAGAAEAALQNFKNQKLSFHQLKKAYEAADKDNNGLTAPELAKVISKCGCTLSNNEMITAIGLLDTDGNGKVSYEEFSKWYNAR